jgi:hypothetical protein
MAGTPFVPDRTMVIYIKCMTTAPGAEGCVCLYARVSEIQNGYTGAKILIFDLKFNREKCIINYTYFTVLISYFFLLSFM